MIGKNEYQFWTQKFSIGFSKKNKYKNKFWCIISKSLIADGTNGENGSHCTCTSGWFWSSRVCITFPEVTSKWMASAWCYTITILANAYESISRQSSSGTNEEDLMNLTNSYHLASYSFIIYYNDILTWSHLFLELCSNLILILGDIQN